MYCFHFVTNTQNFGSNHGAVTLKSVIPIPWGASDDPIHLQGERMTRATRDGCRLCRDVCVDSGAVFAHCLFQVRYKSR